MVYVYLPLMVLPLYASMEKLDFRLIEAGYDLYANRWQVLRRIIMPLVKPGIIAGSILVFIPSLGAYVTPRVLGGGKNMMLGNLIELQFGQGRNWPLGAALSITLMLIVMVALLVYVRNASRSGARPWLSALLRPAAARLHRRSRSSASSCSTRRSRRSSSIRFNAGASLAIWEGFSLRWYRGRLEQRAGPGGGPALAGHRGRRRDRSPPSRPPWRRSPPRAPRAYPRPDARSTP